MKKWTRSTFLAISAITLVLTTPAVAVPTPAAKCQAWKNKAAGKYAACRQNAEKALVSKAGACSLTTTTVCYRDQDCPGVETCVKDPTKYYTAIFKCETKFDTAWSTLEAKALSAGATCPDSPLVVGQFKTVIDAHSGNIATGLAGGGLANCAGDLATCNTNYATCSGSLATCGAGTATADDVLSGKTFSSSAGLGLTGTAFPAQPLKTGQMFCYDAVGGVIACAGAGQDGELQKGVARAYTDNTDGTLTDTKTGLMWEKLDDNDTGGIHDWNTTYTWINAFTKITTLNTPSCFAGYCDWRLPNADELASLAKRGAVNPAIDSTFHTACAPGCTVTTCSCTQSDYYWSSTTYQNSPTLAWSVLFDDGFVFAVFKSNGFYVRAVRGGL